MKILQKTTMPNGTKIQLEDWSNTYSFYKHPVLVAYPISTKTSLWRKEGFTFRMELDSNWNSQEEIKEAFNKLQEGVINLFDLQDHFRREEDVRFLEGF